MTAGPLTVLNILPNISVCVTVLMYGHLYGYSTRDWVFTEQPPFCHSILDTEPISSLTAFTSPYFAIFSFVNIHSYHRKIPTYIATIGRSLTTNPFYIFSHISEACTIIWLLNINLQHSEILNNSN